MKKSLKVEAEHHAQHARFDTGKSVYANKPLNLIDSRSESAAQKQIFKTIDTSPRMVAQQKDVAAIHNSPRMTAQRKIYESIGNSAVQLQSAPEEELMQGRFETAQRMEEEEPLQGQFESVQRMVEDEEPLQGRFVANPVQFREASADKPNNTGLPDNLKTGIESLSGISMDNVRVHYNSEKPAQLNALAYAQGTDIHVASGQEKHLPHEAWHIVQQAQGRVQPTMQMKEGVPINDDRNLEQEADVMGEKAAAFSPAERLERR
ncbi:MAG: DUF4157 domain-containing protein [Nitrosomonas sp.]|nr:DUF4157 domain-containing protein [Nitrosomonas sp.]